MAIFDQTNPIVLGIPLKRQNLLPILETDGLVGYLGDFVLILQRRRQTNDFLAHLDLGPFYDHILLAATEEELLRKVKEGVDTSIKEAQAHLASLKSLIQT